MPPVPGSVQYPTALDTLQTLYEVANNASTLLTSGINNAVTTIPVASTAAFPSTGSISIDSEIIAYEAKDATNFLTCTRGIQSTGAASHSSAAPVEMRVTAGHHAGLSSVVRSLETLVGARTNPAQSGAGRLDNAQWLTARNGGNTADLNLLRGNASGQAEINPTALLQSELWLKGPTPWVDVRAYGAVGDGVTDDSAAIQAAITAAQIDGNEVYFPPLVFAVASTLLITVNCHLRGAGSDGYIFSNSTPANGTTLRWTGAAGGTLIKITPLTGGFRPVVGVIIENMGLNGVNGTANIGIRIEATAQSTFRNLYIRQFNVAGISTGATTDGTYSGLNYTYSCRFDNIWAYNYEAVGDCIRLDGLGSGAGLDTAFCSFTHMYLYHRNGNGISVVDADDNYFAWIVCGRSSGGTGYGVELFGTNANGKGARANFFDGLWCTAGVMARGTTGYTYPSRNNTIVGLSLEDAAPEPVLETGATLAWSSVTNGRESWYDGGTITLGTATGTKIGTAATEKMAFYGATPIVRPSSTTDLRTALVNLGLYTTGGASPLDLNGGALTSPRLTILATAGDVGSPVAGEHWYNSTQKSHRLQATAGTMGLVGLVYANTADDALASGGTAELKFASQYAIPAAGLTVGKSIRVLATGSISIDATASQTTTLRIKLGDATSATSGTLVASTIYTNTASNLNNMPWSLECIIQIRSATTVWASGMAYFCAVAATPFTAVAQHLANAGGVATATTIPNISTAHTVHLTGQPNDTGMTITIRNISVEIMN